MELLSLNNANSGGNNQKDADDYSRYIDGKYLQRIFELQKRRKWVAFGRELVAVIRRKMDCRMSIITAPGF